MSKEKIRLTFDEYMKASAAGMSAFGGACACIGPRDRDEYCPCYMNLLGVIIPEDQYKLKALWASNGYHPRDPLTIEQDNETEEERIAREKAYLAKIEYEKLSPYRRKRLELIAAKEAATKSNG